MVDAIVAKTLRDANGKYAFLFGNASDGTGESGVKKIDISTLTGAPTKIKINKMKWSCDGMQVKILFDHTTDDTVAILSGRGELDAACEASIIDPGSAGDTGDVLFTTAGHTAGDGYTIYMECEKVA